MHAGIKHFLVACYYTVNWKAHPDRAINVLVQSKVRKRPVLHDVSMTIPRLQNALALFQSFVSPRGTFKKLNRNKTIQKKYHFCKYCLLDKQLLHQD